MVVFKQTGIAKNVGAIARSCCHYLAGHFALFPMRRIILLIIFLCPYLGAEAKENSPQSLATLLGKTDWSCMKLTMSVCPTPVYPYVGIYYRYWEPSLFIETVSQTGESVIIEAEALFDAPLKASANIIVHGFTENKNVDVSANISFQNLNSTRLNFFESHLYDYPLKSIMGDVLCPSSSGGVLLLRYASEMDVMAYRQDKSNLTQWPIGSWGTLWPRTGFHISAVNVLSSALIALRSVDIAALPLGHQVISPLDYRPDYIKDRMQMVYPNKSSCTILGDPFWNKQEIEQGRNAYIWIFWHYRECCRPL